MSEIKYLDLNGLQNYTDDLKDYLSNNYCQVLEFNGYITTPVNIGWDDLTDNYDDGNWEIVYCQYPLLDGTRPVMPAFLYRNKTDNNIYSLCWYYDGSKISEYQGRGFGGINSNVLFKYRETIYLYHIYCSRQTLITFDEINNYNNDNFPVFDEIITEKISPVLSNEFYYSNYPIVYCQAAMIDGNMRSCFCYKYSNNFFYIDFDYFYVSELIKYQDSYDGNIKKDQIFKHQSSQNLYIFDGTTLVKLGDTSQIDTLNNKVESIENDYNKNSKFSSIIYKTIGSTLELVHNRQTIIDTPIISELTLTMDSLGLDENVPYIYDLVFKMGDTLVPIVFSFNNQIEWVKQPIFEAGKKYLVSFCYSKGFRTDAPGAPSSGTTSMGDKRILIGMWCEIN